MHLVLSIRKLTLKFCNGQQTDRQTDQWTDIVRHRGNDNDDAICERPNCGKTLPDMSDNDCLENIVGGRDNDVFDGGNPRTSKKMSHSQGFGEGTEADIDSYLQERTQASNIQYENSLDAQERAQACA
jgi:hypothetical protein